MNDYDDFTGALMAKSDQINATDITGDAVVKIIGAVYDPAKEQPMDVFLEGYPLPWRPSKGMRRIMADAWRTTKCSQLVGKKLMIYCNKDVTFGKDKMGGIQIKAMADIPKTGINTTIRKGRKPIPYRIEYLDTPLYPADQFDKTIDAMCNAMASGQMTLQQVVARCQETGDLTPEQLSRLEERAPKPE